MSAGLYSWLLAALLAAGSSVAAPVQTAALRVQQVQGQAELHRAQGWQPAHAGALVDQGLRTGEEGRVWLASSGGDRPGALLAGPASQVGVSRGEAALQGGQFLLQGPLAAFVQGRHLVLERGAQARVDLRGAEQRVALLTGSGRLALGGRTLSLQAGRQVALGSGAVTAYAEESAPWYAPRLQGTGQATVQATRGPVYVSGAGHARQVAQIGRTLQPGQRLSTGQGAWAEVGFVGGGYLRLQAGSELSVLAGGPTTVLQLTRGSAWNVARVPSAGHPALVGTALRGTAFQLGVTGLTRTFGPGAASGPPAAPVTAGHLNGPLDNELERPLTLRLDPVPARLQTLRLGASSLPGARVSAQVGRRSFALAPADGAGRFTLNPPGTPLPEGPHTVVVRAEWRGQVRTQTLRVVLDRTPPRLSDLRAEQRGNLLLLSGTVQDEAAPGGSRLTLTVQLGRERFTRSVVLADDGSGTFEVPLPAADSASPVQLTLEDGAGNESRASLS